MDFTSAVNRVTGANDSRKANLTAIRLGHEPFTPSKPAMRSVVQMLARRSA